MVGDSPIDLLAVRQPYGYADDLSGVSVSHDESWLPVRWLHRYGVGLLWDSERPYEPARAFGGAQKGTSLWLPGPLPQPAELDACC